MALKDELKKQEKQAERKRPRARATLNGRNVLRVDDRDKDPEYEYRMVNDVGDRVENLKERGYEVVDKPVRVGDRRVATPGSEGSPITVSVGGGMKGVLMRQRKEFYEEDMADKQRYVDDLEQATKSSKAGDYGSIKVERNKS